MGIAGAVAGGLFDVFAGREANKANLAAARDTAGGDERRLNLALASQQQESPFQSTIQDPKTKAFVTDFGPAGANAAKSRQLATMGDISNITDINTRLANARPTLPTLASARDVISGDEKLRFGEFEKGLADIVSSRQRLGEGIQLPNSKFEGGTVDAIGRYSDANRRGGEQAAINLFQAAGINDERALEAFIKNRQPQGPQAPGFTTPDRAATASQAIAQIAPPDAIPDLGSTIPFATGSNIIKQVRDDERTSAIVAALKNRFPGNQGIFG